MHHTTILMHTHVQFPLYVVMFTSKIYINNKIDCNEYKSGHVCQVNINYNRLTVVVYRAHNINIPV